MWWKKKGKKEKKRKTDKKTYFVTQFLRKTCKNAMIITINKQRVRIELYTAFVCLVMEYLYIKY